MKFLLFTFAFFFFTFYSVGQNIFNKTYNGLGAETTRDIIIQEENYFTAGGEIVETTLSIAVFNIGLNGNFIESKYYADTCDWYHGIGNSLKETQSNNYIFGGGRDKGFYRDNLLLKLDNNLDTIFTKKYFPVDDNGDKDVLISNTNIDKDSSYLLIGSSNIDNDYNILPNYRMQLIKTDTLGNLLWRKVIGKINFKYYGYKVTPAFDGGYILAGWSSRNGGDNVVIKVDENCENAIYKYNGHPTYDDGRVMAITPTKDSCYLISSEIVISNNGSHDVAKARLMKLDRDLNTIWDKQYFNPGRAAYIVNALEKPNGEIILNGAETRFGDNAPLIAMMKLTTNGDSLWKETTTTFDTTTTDNFGESAKLTPDGGMIIAGWCTSYLMEPTQQMFLIKTDSTGCDGTEWTHCGAVDIVEPALQSNTDKGLRVYPNPASATLNITLSELQMQTDFADVTDKKIITNHKNLCQKNNNLTIEQFKDLTIDKKLKYNSKHPKQNLWSKSDRAELLAFARKQAIMLPFDVLRGEVDIFAIEPALALAIENEQLVKNKYSISNIQQSTLNKTTHDEQRLIEIYDIYGRLVKSVNRTGLSDNEETTINISDLKSGIYLLKVGRQTTKFIKQ